MKNKNLYWIIAFIIIVIIIIGLLFYFNTSQSVYSTSRTCSTYMTSISNPNMNIPFNWQYSTKIIRCITSIKDVKNGCSITYITGVCSSVPNPSPSPSPSPSPTCIPNWVMSN